jgi:glycosyltransferase involved in cell wall biosynthesis
MSRDPKVSVIITAYNREKYIAFSIESVLAQTFTDFELLIVDDCSTDATAAIAHSYQADYRVRVIVNPRNLGQFPNRNYAAEHARGAFLKYHDSDDIMYPGCLGAMVSSLEAEPRAGFALSSNHYWAGGPCPMLSTPAMSFQREFLGWGGVFSGAPAHALFRTEVFRSLGGFPEAGPFSDFLFWPRACAKVNVLLISADLFWYRIHAEQQPVTDFEKSATYGDIWKLLHEPECPLAGSELIQARRNWSLRVAREIFSSLLRGRPSLAVRKLRASSIGPAQWCRYLFFGRHRRSMLAGVPLDQNGDYVVAELLSPKSRDGG